MHNDKSGLDFMLENLKARRPAGEFCSAGAFKKEFFRRAAEMDRGSRRPYFRHPALRAAAAALVLIAVFGIFYLGQLPGVSLSEDDLRTKIRETVALLGNQSGVGFLGDELFTFNRQGRSAPDRILKVSIFDGGSRMVAGLAMAIGESDFAEVKSDAVTGEILSARTGDGTDVVETDLSVRLADGKVVKFRDLVVEGAPDNISLDGYRVERELVAI